MNFAARLIRASIYGVVVGTLSALTFAIGGAILSVITGNSVPLTPQQMGLLGFGLGFSAPVAMDFSRAFEESTTTETKKEEKQ